MPGARTHDMLTVVTGIGGMPLLWVALPDHNIAAVVTWAGAHLVSGLAFSPDLDLASELYRRWGPLRVLWWPYREVVKHRDWVSHSLVLGPLLRLAYFLLISSIVVLGFVLALSYVMPVDGGRLLLALRGSLRDLWTNHFSMLMFFLLGFVTGGAVHSLADWFTTGPDPFHRMLFRSRRRRRSRRRDDEWGIW